MSWWIKDVVVKEDGNHSTVTIKFEKHAGWRVVKREQKTFPLVHLERMLKQAKIEVPLRRLNP